MKEKGTSIRLSVNFQEKLCRPEGSGMTQSNKRKKKLPTKIYLAKLSVRFDGEIKTITNKQNWKSLAPSNQVYKKY